MENALSILSELEALDVKLTNEEGRLRYSAPAGVLTPSMLTRIASNKKELLDLLQKRANDLAFDEQPIPCQPRNKGLPLSAAQQRFWFLDRLDHGNSAAFVMPPIVLRMSGELNVRALECALNEVAQRHEILRSAFRIEEDMPVQVSLSNVTLTLTQCDLSEYAQQARENEVARIIRQEALTPFDLQCGEILMRALLLKCGVNEHCFILTMHHIIADGWSMGILIDELSQLYRYFSSSNVNNAGNVNHPAALANILPALPIQYADYAHWEHARMHGGRLEKQRDYWLKKLGDAPSFLSLLADRPRPRVRSNRGRSENFEIGAELTERFGKLCTRAGVTPFMALLSVFGVLLCRHSDAEDMVIGSPIAVRPHSQTERLIGLFLNTLALRLDLSCNPSFIELLGRVRKIALEAFEHREMPFDQLLQALGLERNVQHTPLFQVLFAFQNAPMGPVTLDGLRITPQPSESLHAPFDLVLSMEEGQPAVKSQGLTGFFRYNTDLFEASSIVRLVAHFRQLLEGLIDHPDMPVRTVPMLAEDELRQLREWRGGTAQFSAQLPVHRIAQQHAQKRPDAIAVRYGESHEESHLTYRELDERSNQVAQRLRRLGVMKGDRVGLSVERSLELVIGILGILKAGAAYVPLDPSYPEDRLRYIAEDSALRVVLTHKSALSFQTDVVDLCDPTLAQESISALEAFETLEQMKDVAYVMYTSGSTGRPKGVEVTHANVARLFHCSESLFGFGEDDVWSLFHSYAFDFSVWELWGALVYGGQVVVVPFGVSRSPDAFYAFLCRNGVTVLNQTASAFRQLIDADRRLQETQGTQGSVAEKLALKWVIFGGEALDPRSLSGWVERHGLDTPQLINMYGITETTVHVTFHRLTAQDIATGRSAIGQPLPDLSVDLIDRYGQPAPVGVAGEIWVGGAGVAKGYLNLPELTAQRFVNGMYRSGDLARWCADGCMEYIGRIDHQVKIRGFRIELGEIESTLAKHSFVSEAVVEAHRDGSDNGAGDSARLVAYVASSSWQDDTLVSVLRAHLKAHLPDYMVPAILLPMERLPLTANGKLDRKALTAMLTQYNREGPKTGTSTGANMNTALPQTPLEKMLAELWRETLGIGQVAQIGLDDHFFELGGDSIRGAILVNKIQERLRSVVYVVALFEAPTIRQLVEYLRAHYPEAIARLEGAGQDVGMQEHADRVDEEEVAAFRELIPPMPAFVPKKGISRKNPRAVFVLSPPRSGSTLLRVLLGGHPALFSPPELELLGFETLGQRKHVCSGRDAFWLEGTLRAVMAVLNVDADEAKKVMAGYEAADMPVKDFYGELQAMLGNRILVDKSPSYALDVNVLQRAEDYFEEPLYLHLHRHPYGMISSFEEAKLNQIFFRYPHRYPVRRLAELIWVQSHRNIARFLSVIPAERQMAISFEHISQKPEESAKRLCDFIGIDFKPDMLDIYAGQDKKQRMKQRMTDGIYQESKMLGDTKFHTHSRIDPAVAERWRDVYKEDFLGEPSWAMAQSLAYVRPSLETAAIVRVQRDGPMAQPQLLSFAQQRLWFLDQLEAARNVYNMPVALRLKGPLHREALAGSLRAIVERHEVLRSHFETVDGIPLVRIDAAIPEMAEFDLSHLTPAAREQELMERMRQDAEQPFDLARGPLFRSALLKMGHDDHAVLVNMHHIVSDGWSMGIMADEWSKLYNAAVAGQDASLPPLSPLQPLVIQYADYAFWQRSHLAGDRLLKQLHYWRKQLDGAPALLELPTDRPRPAIQRFAGDVLEISAEPELSAQLKRLADRSGVSLYMLLMAVFGVLLARYSGQRDIVLGSPTANRSRSEIEGLIGFFVNTLVMRLAIAPDQPFSEFLAHVRKTALEAYANQDVPFEQLVEELRPQRNLSYSPLFQVMFSMQNAPLTAPALTGLTVREITARQVVAKYDLTLAVADRDGVLEASFEFNRDLFDRATIARFANHYLHLLQAVARTPQQSVDRLTVMSFDERVCIGAEWNATAVSFGGPATIHGLFEAQVARSPDAIALQFGTQTLTYRELNRRADALAEVLRANGLQPGQLAAICVTRSPEMVIGLLAVLKSGCAYVPLDPVYPPERLRYVLDDAGVSLLVTQSHLFKSLPAVACGVVVLDGEKASVTARNAADGSAYVGLDHAGLAYVIYTSGSTGNPKGVMISHRAAVNFLNAMRAAPGIDASDTLLAVTTISFDIAVLELYLPLSAGARVILANDDTTCDANALMHTIATERVTLMQATPATWRLLLAMDWKGSADLTILCGGEAMPASLAQSLLGRCKRLWNMYGPTETTVWSTMQRVTENDLTHATIPIGRPVANTRIYIVDAAMNLQPIGVAGELLIGGDGLAEGYLNRPDLSTERFIDDPFMMGQRLYRTGDVARYLSDGCIEYLGRSDQQVKVRGFRIELGEIEHVLARQPGIAVCAVALDRDINDEGRLVAYYTGEPVEDYTLRQALREVLPDYMVPNLFVHLHAMPLTPNGKIDRRALRVPEGVQANRNGEFAGFRDSIELDLVRIWEEVLGVNPIGIHDNFFELGGHSIIAVRLMAKVAQRFGRHLPLASLFQGASVEAMARLLRSQSRGNEWSSIVPIQMRGQGKQPAMFCVAGAGGNVVYFNDLAMSMTRTQGHDRPFYGLQPPGLNGTSPVHDSVESLAASYLDSIEIELQETPRILAGHSFGGLVAFEMACRLTAAGQAPAALILIDTPAPHFFAPTGSDWGESQWLAQVSDIVSHLYGVDVRMAAQELDAFDDKKQLYLLHDKLMATGVLPQGSDVAFFRGFVNVYKANLRVNYAPKKLASSSMKILLLRSQDEQPQHLLSEKFATVRSLHDLGWQNYFEETISVKEIPGDHLTMMRMPNVNVLAEILNEFISADFCKFMQRAVL